MEKIENLVKLKTNWKKNLDEVIKFWTDNSIDKEHGGFYTCLDAKGTVIDKTKFHWLQGRQVWTFSRLFNECGNLDFFNKGSNHVFVAYAGFKFMHKAKAADGTLFFSTTESGEHLHFQRKPYAAVFYSMGLLEFSKAVTNLPDNHEMKLKLDAVQIKTEAVLYYDKLRMWMADPTLIGGQSADRRVSKLGDVMCICGLAVDFYENEKDENNKKKYIEIMKDAAKTAKLHYSTEHKIFMENALLGTGLTFQLQLGDCVIQDIQSKFHGFCYI
ncbi:unnamed protein product [Oikopleura dioica]|uniref:N-acylglucosamine 2-epimerase n=1 Tax=Oikopleura dioica TaxID=34765 RepID=E4YAP8_OIKDI|nr:unnamed protein product [Oikopleura dioica]